MITGNVRQEALTVEDLLYYTSGGKEIYEMYLGKQVNSRTIMKRPWGSDNHPSWGVFFKDDVWLWKDQATEEVGNAVAFVQKLYDISYKEAIDKIKGDFGLGDKQSLKDRHYVIQASEPKKYAHITAKTIRFKERHHSFWNPVEVTEDWCKKYDCYAVKELAINRKRVHIGENETVFVYLADDIKKVKVYFPERRDMRFRTNAPSDYLWEAHRVECCNRLAIHKSMKDLITFAQIFPYNIATQNESIKLFNEEVVSKINTLSPDPWLFYGSDPDGVKKCTEVTKINGWKYINTPSAMLPAINDVYGYVKQHGLKKLEEFCKQKHLI